MDINKDMDMDKFPRYIKARMYRKIGKNKWELREKDEYIATNRIIAFYSNENKDQWVIKWLKVSKNAIKYYLVIDPEYVLYFKMYDTNIKSPHSVLHLI
jgi:hypothetical protein